MFKRKTATSRIKQQQENFKKTFETKKKETLKKV